MVSTNVAWQTPPNTWGGSVPEWAIYWAHGKLNLIEGVNFVYQSPFAGGRLFLGGAVIDFLEIDINTAIRVQGLYYHGKSESRASDQAQRIQIESRGIVVVDIDDDDALENPVYYLKEARRGISHTKLR